MDNWFCCPICGGRMEETQIKCRYCNINIAPIQSSKDIVFYAEESIKRYGNHKHARDILIEEEIQHNPQFDRAAYESRIQAKQKRESEKRLDSMIQHMTFEKNKNLPKCPTCSSVNIRKIGTLERGASFSLFGFASGKIGKSMVCKDCGYKW